MLAANAKETFKSKKETRKQKKIAFHTSRQDLTKKGHWRQDLKVESMVGQGNVFWLEGTARAKTEAGM